MNRSRAFALVGTWLMVLSLAGGAVVLAQSPTVSEPAEETTGLDTAIISPVGSADASLAVGLAAGVVLGVGAKAVADHVTSPSEEELARQDAIETLASIHGNALTLQQKNQELLDTYSNRLKDTTSVARKIGQNALYRAYENGTTTSLAQQQAYDAIEDYYAGRQAQVLTSWNSTMTAVRKARDVARNTSSATADEAYTMHKHVNPSGDVNTQWQGEDFNRTVTVTLVNGSTVDVPAFSFTWGWQSTTASYTDTYHPAYDPTNIDYANAELDVPAPTNDFNRVDKAVDPDKWQSRWAAIENKTSEMKTTIDNVYQSTHDGYQQGTIDPEQLYDPTYAADQPGPDANWGSYTLVSMIEAGYGHPEDLDTVGTMNVSNNGTVYTGILLSDGDPPNGKFVVGNTYNASDLAGPQLVADMDRQQLVKLQGNFTLQNATSPSGETLSEVSYTSVSYNTTNAAEYKQALNKSTEQRAEEEGRQQKMRDDATGGGLPGIPNPLGFGGLGSIFIIGFALLIASRIAD